MINIRNMHERVFEDDGVGDWEGEGLEDVRL
jgi:hypothetical protein